PTVQSLEAMESDLERAYRQLVASGATGARIHQDLTESLRQAGLGPADRQVLLESGTHRRSNIEIPERLHPILNKALDYDVRLAGCQNAYDAYAFAKTEFLLDWYLRTAKTLFPLLDPGQQTALRGRLLSLEKHVEEYHRIRAQRDL